MTIAILEPVPGGERVIHLTDAAVVVPGPPLRVLDLGGTGLSPLEGWISEDGGKSFRDPTVQTLAEAQAARTASLRAACTAAIVGGFASSALGAPHTYPSDEASQRNLQAARHASGVVPLLMCADLNQSWMLLPHADLQVEQVNADWLGHRQAQQEKLVAALARLDAAADAAAAEAVTWA